MVWITVLFSPKQVVRVVDKSVDSWVLPAGSRLAVAGGRGMVIE